MARKKKVDSDNCESSTDSIVSQERKPAEKKQTKLTCNKRKENGDFNEGHGYNNNNSNSRLYNNSIVIQNSSINLSVVNKCNCGDDEPCNCEKYETCIPAPSNHKPKQPLEYKLKVLVKDAKAPSVLGAYFVKLVSRYLENKTPQDELETEVFNLLKDKYKDLRNLFQCGVNNFQKVPADIRNKIFDERLSSSEYVDLDTVTNWFAGEVEQLYAMGIGSTNSECPTEGIAGLPRPEPGIDNEPELFPRIFYLNNLRTSGYRPFINAFDYTPEEIMYECTSTECKPVIKDVSEPCESDYVYIDQNTKLCLDVPAVDRGDNVVLRGMNFVDTTPQVKVRLPMPGPDGPVYVYLEGHVCGDTKTPVYETVNSEERVIADSRVNDVLTFKIPDNFTEGKYQFQIIFDNTTDGEWSSDEVGLKIVALPILQDGTAGSKILTEVELGDVDAPYTAAFGDSKIIYSGNNVAQLSIIFLGHEIDSEEAYEKQITGFFDSLNDIVLDSIYAKIADKAILLIKQIPVYGQVIGYIAEAISYVIYGLVALWAPPDLIMQETLTLSWMDLARLTSMYYPMLAEESTLQDGNIVVTRKPITKSSNHYEETRIHNSLDEGSHYNLSLIYSRL